MTKDGTESLRNLHGRPDFKFLTNSAENLGGGARRRIQVAKKQPSDETLPGEWASRLKVFKAHLGVRSRVDDVAEALALLDVGALMRWMNEERPSVRAVLLCLSPLALKPALLSALDETSRTDVLLKLGTLKSVSDDALLALADEAAARFSQGSRRVSFPGARGATGAQDAKSRTAALLQGLESGLAEGLLQAVAARDSGLAERLRRDLVTVPRLAALFPADRRALLCALPEFLLCVFLYGARRIHGEPTVQAFLAVFSKARQDDLEERIACLGNVRQVDVEAAFRAAIEKAVALKADGSLSFPWEEAWVS